MSNLCDLLSHDIISSIFTLSENIYSIRSTCKLFLKLSQNDFENNVIYLKPSLQEIFDTSLKSFGVFISCSSNLEKCEFCMLTFKTCDNIKIHSISAQRGLPSIDISTKNLFNLPEIINRKHFSNAFKSAVGNKYNKMPSYARGNKIGRQKIDTLSGFKRKVPIYEPVHRTQSCNNQYSEKYDQMSLSLEIQIPILQERCKRFSIKNPHRVIQNYIATICNQMKTYREEIFYFWLRLQFGEAIPIKELSNEKMEKRRRMIGDSDGKYKNPEDVTNIYKSMKHELERKIMLLPSK